VKRLLQIFTILLALAWLPIATHCSWEDLVAGDWFKCAPNTAERGSCSGDADSCTQLESATYKISDTHTDFLPLVFIAFSDFIVFEFPVDEQPITVITTPPEIPSSWQFSFRTALPPRAPSLA